MHPKQMDRYAKIDSCIVQHETTQVQAASESTPPSPSNVADACIHPNPLTPSAMNKKNGIDRESVKGKQRCRRSTNPPRRTAFGDRPPPTAPKHQLFLPLSTKQRIQQPPHTHTHNQGILPHPLSLCFAGVDNDASGDI